MFKIKKKKKIISFFFFIYKMKSRSKSSKRSKHMKKSKTSKRSKTRKHSKKSRKLIKSRRKIRSKERAKRASRGCSRQSTKKYSSRSSPPFPANNCCGMTKKGNDGLTYKSVAASNGICRWVNI